MADSEHVRVVQSGKESIATWRRENPTGVLDLRRADLARLSLNQCDLHNADLEWADLRWADLVAADLTGANCTRTDFHKADLTTAVLERATLINTNFEDANLAATRFANSLIGGTRFLTTDLSTATGLGATRHQKPSQIDDETLQVSLDLPKSFLNGCGVYLPFQAVVYRVLLGGPKDVESDVKRARESIHSWNDHNSRRHGTVLLPVWWRTHATPELGDRPQGLLNRQIVDQGDIMVAVFWSRLGTPTGEAESGTAEEIERFLDANKPVLAYFCNRPLRQDFDERQWQRLKEFRSHVQKRGLTGEFSSGSDLARQLHSHLSATLDRLQRDRATAGGVA